MTITRYLDSLVDYFRQPEYEKSGDDRRHTDAKGEKAFPSVVSNTERLIAVNALLAFSVMLFHAVCTVLAVTTDMGTVLNAIHSMEFEPLVEDFVTALNHFGMMMFFLLCFFICVNLLRGNIRSNRENKKEE